MTQSLKLEALALDIGGGHVTAARVSLEGREMLNGKVHRPVDPQASAEVLLDTWAAAALGALDGYVLPVRIGVAVPSPFDHVAGVSWMTHKFAALYGASVREGLRKRWAGTPLVGAPLAFGNDADLFTLGEWWGGGAGHRRDAGNRPWLRLRGRRTGHHGWPGRTARRRAMERQFQA